MLDSKKIKGTIKLGGTAGTAGKIMTLKQGIDYCSIVFLFLQSKRFIYFFSS